MCLQRAQVVDPDPLFSYNSLGGMVKNANGIRSDIPSSEKSSIQNGGSMKKRSSVNPSPPPDDKLVYQTPGVNSPHLDSRTYMMHP